MTDNLTKQNLMQRLGQLQAELDDVIARWPSHSVKPGLIIERENLEEEIMSIKEQLQGIS